MKLKKTINYFSKAEIGLWCGSVLFIITSFCLFDRENLLTLAASLIGVTSLIFNAKGNPAGQALMIVFSFIYGWISYSFSYYGEMITYVDMTGPMAAFALISYISVIICLAVFLVNVIYGFVNWCRIEKRQIKYQNKRVSAT